MMDSRPVYSLSVYEDAEDDFEEEELDKTNEIMRHVIITQNRLHQKALSQLWNSNGVAKIEESDKTTSGDIEAQCPTGIWEMTEEEEDVQCQIITSEHTNLEQLLQKTSVNEPSYAERHRDNDTASTCSLSAHSMYSSTKEITFLSATDDRLKKKSYAKRQLRAIASMLDPKMKRKVKERKGIWGGCYDDEDKCYEKSIEVEYGKEPVPR